MDSKVIVISAFFFVGGRNLFLHAEHLLGFYIYYLFDTAVGLNIATRNTIVPNA